MTDSRFDGLVFPLRTWRGLDAVTKLALYTRLSLQSAPIAVALVTVMAASGEKDLALDAFWRAVIAVFAVVAAVFAAVTFELHPDLNTRERRDVRPVFRAGLLFASSGLVLWLVILLIPGVSTQSRNAALVLAMFTLFILALVYFPWMRFSWLLVVATTLTVALVLAQSHGAGLWWLVVPPTLTMTLKLSVWTLAMMKEIERARVLEASLKVTEERLRFAQELHDTLGQHLAAMSVKSELALALSRRGDARLEGELQELQQLTRLSMAEMRAVVKGYRSIDLSREIDGARSLLDDAGIALYVHGGDPGLGRAHGELAAWFVREATTNVLRHSEASSVDLHLSTEEVSMSNDGAHGEMGRISGLGALRQRAEAMGVSLIVEREGTVFTARLVRGVGST
ncbi:sensor histidine kinase [Corynebacterium pacaense]|uniref:sensor histidine kinase n=1 Tax=Corynebacterium pacaense TaxID=1816684 RepID=UPI0009BA7D18|nr:histidine kinase [Corynebacterium pacaense]